MKVLMLCLHAFEVMGFVRLLKCLAGQEMNFIDRLSFQKQVMTTFHVSVIMDICIEDVVVEDYDAIALPRGFEDQKRYVNSTKIKGRKSFFSTFIGICLSIVYECMSYWIF